MPSQLETQSQTTAPGPPLEEHLSYEDSRRFLLDHHDTLWQGGSYELSNLSDGQHGTKSGDATQRVKVVIDDDDSTLHQAPKKMWNSIWLHSYVLIGLLALFTAMFIATIALFHFSEARHGLSTTISKNRYSWTYSPTARQSHRY